MINTTPATCRWGQGPKTTLDAVAHASVSKRVSLTSNVVNSVRFVAHSIKGFSHSVARPCEPLKLFNLVTLPFHLVDIVGKIFSLPGSSNNEKVDVLLAVAGGASSTGLGVATIAEGLASVGAVALRNIAWATPLTMVSAAFGIADIVLTSKQFVEGHRFSKQFHQAVSPKKTAEMYTLEDFKKGVDLLERKHLKEKSFIKKHCDVEGKSLIGRLQRIEEKARPILASGDQEKAAKCKKTLKLTMEMLAKRITTSKWSKALRIVANAVGLIGIALLFTPLFPLGFALLGALSVFGIANTIANIASQRKFEKELSGLENSLKGSL